MNQVYFWEIEESEYSDLFDRLLSMVSSEKQERVLKMRFPIDQLLTLCADVLVRFLVCGQFNIGNDDLMFSLNEYGKPYLQDHPNFYFNISHTRNALTVAVSNNDIGVDIEQISAVDIKIADRFFTSPERNFVLHSADKNRAFCQVWTGKEAYIKFLGKGLSIPLGSFSILDNEISKITQTFERRGYYISVCGLASHKIPLIDVRRPQFGDRFSNFLSMF